LQLESNAAIEDERSKLKTFLGTHEISIKEYFEDKIKSKEKDIDSLKRLLSEKEDDIRELIVKYNALEKRMDIML
jgi:succinate dehydrogenase flavin-adding protein (antitoxin of CptAB toxin-antitoxin module)